MSKDKRKFPVETSSVRWAERSVIATLVAERKKASLSDKEIARRMKVSDKTIKRIEGGRATLSEAKAYAKALNR